MSNLEQSFADICEKHDLTIFQVCFNAAPGAGHGWSASAHWSGFTNTRPA